MACTPVPSSTRAPRAPRVITRLRAPVRSRSRWRSPAPASFDAASCAASCSFTTRGSAFPYQGGGPSGAGAALTTSRAPVRTASSPAARWTAGGISFCVTMTRASTSPAGSATRVLAPWATTMVFSPRASTWMNAVPVGTPASRRSHRMSTPAASRASACLRPASSSPTAPAIATRTPPRAAATAWLAPLPPHEVASSEARSVSPGSGSRSTDTTTSSLTDPTTSTSTSMSRLPSHWWVCAGRIPGWWPAPFACSQDVTGTRRRGGVPTGTPPLAASQNLP